MQWELRRLSLGALNCSWNVLRTPEASILTCTWSFAEGETIGVVGVLNHTNFVKFGGGAVVNFSVTRDTTGKRLKTFSRLSARLLDTLQNTSASALVSLGLESYLHGIQETGFLSDAELERSTIHLRYQGSSYQRCWIRSSVLGVLLMDTSTVCISSPPPTANGG